MDRATRADGYGRPTTATRFRQNEQRQPDSPPEGWVPRARTTPARPLLLVTTHKPSVYTHVALRARRRSTTRAPRATANDLQFPKTVELEQRIARLELKLQQACEALEQTHHQLTAVQARLDHYAARFGVL